MEHRTHFLEDFPTWDFSLESRNHKGKIAEWDLEAITLPLSFFTVLFLCTSKIFIYIIYTILYTIYYSIILYYGRYEKKGGFWNKKSCSVLLCIVQFTFLSSFLLNKFCFSPLPLCSIGKLWILFKLKSNYCISEKSLF